MIQMYVIEHENGLPLITTSLEAFLMERDRVVIIKVYLIH